MIAAFPTFSGVLCAICLAVLFILSYIKLAQFKEDNRDRR